MIVVVSGAGLVVWALPLAGDAETGILRRGEEVPVTATDIGLGVASNSPTLATDPADPRFVVLANRLDSPDFGCALQVSGDGGEGWVPASPVPVLPPGVDKCYAPEVGFDRHGVLYYLFVGLAGRGNTPMGVFLTASADRARTFSPPEPVLGPLNFGVRMVIDADVGPRGRIHLVWLHASAEPALGGFASVPNPILAAHSDDGGKTFSEPMQVSDPDRRRVVAPALALGPDHRVHVAYYDLGGDARDYQGLEGPTWEGTWSVVASTSTHGGRRFGRGVVVDDGMMPSSRVMLIFTMPPPALVVGAQRACVAWTDARHGDDDVLLRCSTDDGRRWGALRRVNDDPVGSGHSQYLPRLAMAPDGRVDAVFYDRRGDIRNQNAHLAFASSADGRRFSRNVAITRFPSDSQIGARYGVVSARGLVERGSRLALLSDGSSALAAWADTRNARPTQIAQDVYALRLGLSPGSRRPAWVAPVGAGLVVLGTGALVTLALVRRRRSPGP